MIENKGLHSKMMDQTMQSVYMSDLILFMVDGREGITKDDKALIQNLNQKYNLTNHRVETQSQQQIQKKILADQKVDKQIIYVVNKCEDEFSYVDYEPIYKLGIGDPVFISCYHGDNM